MNNIPEKYASQYNVHDFLKDKSPEEIKNYCQAKSSPAALAMFNVGYDYNVAQIWRVANCLGFKEIYHIQAEGKRADKRGCVGAQNYTDCIHCYNEGQFFNAIKDKYIPIAVENNISFPSYNMYGVVPPHNAVFIFGAENQGLSDSVLSKCEKIITIPSFGAIRSLNVGCTAAIVSAWYRGFYK
ncbi:MAG: hypothetical protein EKK57_04975 [Proteobacteria bacterium]|nr:MAG: hypothetical protein EKK57_04975 [Pseudomonadota bacterium]